MKKKDIPYVCGDDPRKFGCVIWIIPDYYGCQSLEAFVSSYADYRHTGCTPMRGPATPQNRHYCFVLCETMQANAIPEQGHD